MTREELKGIIEGITDEQLKSVLDINSADIGKAKGEFDRIKTENETLKKGQKELEEKITALTDDASDKADYKKQLEDLQREIKEKEDAEKLKKEDAELTAKIEEIFGDKKFTSDYVKKGIISDMKTEIAKSENKGKGYAEIFESITKDKTGIFQNPNPPANMEGFGAVDTGSVSEDTMRAIMGLVPNKE